MIDMGVMHLKRKLLVIILIFSVILSFTTIHNSSNKIVAEGKEPIILNNTIFSIRV